jgi:hypothetical protein
MVSAIAVNGCAYGNYGVNVPGVCTCQTRPWPVGHVALPGAKFAMGGFGRSSRALLRLHLSCQWASRCRGCMPWHVAVALSCGASGTLLGAVPSAAYAGVVVTHK